MEQVNGIRLREFRQVPKVPKVHLHALYPGGTDYGVRVSVGKTGDMRQASNYR